MSTDLAVARAGEIAERFLTDPAIAAALMAAQATPEGIVIADADAASAAVDSAQTMKAAMKATKEWEASCERLPNAMIAAIRGVTRDRIGNVLAAAVTRIGNAHTAWKVAEARRAEEERRKAAAEAAKAEAAAKVEQTLDDDAPPSVAPVAPPPAITRGAAGSGFLRYELEVEVADIAEAAKHYPEAFAMKLQPAQNAFRRYIAQNGLDEGGFKKIDAPWFSFNGLRARFVPDSTMKGARR